MADDEGLLCQYNPPSPLYPHEDCARCAHESECRAPTETLQGTEDMLRRASHEGLLTTTWAIKAAHRLLLWARGGRADAVAVVRRLAKEATSYGENAHNLGIMLSDINDEIKSGRDKDGKPTTFVCVGCRRTLPRVKLATVDNYCDDCLGYLRLRVKRMGPLRVTPTPVTYCENAPPRDVVERASITLDGIDAGRPLRVPLVFSERMAVEWERHERVLASRNREARFDAEIAPPETPDAFGGIVIVDDGRGMRCVVCGGWLRELRGYEEPTPRTPTPPRARRAA